MLTKEKIHQVFLSLPFPIVLLEPRGQQFFIVGMNTAYLELNNVEKRDLIGKENIEGFPGNINNPTDINLIQTSLKEVIQEEKITGVEKLKYVRYPSQSPEMEVSYWKLENIPVFDSAGKIEIIICISRDITDQELAREQLELEAQNQRQLSVFIEENIDALFSLSRDGTFTSANNRILEALDISLEVLLGMTFLPLCAAEHKTRVSRHFEKSLSGVATKFEADFFSSKGVRMTLQIALMPLKTNNSIQGVYGIAKDITGLRQTEKVVLEKKKFLEVNAVFISSLLEKDLDYELLEKAFSIIGKAIRCDRMSYIEAHRVPGNEEVFFSKMVEWNSKADTSVQNSSALQNMPINKVRQFLGPLFENKPFIAHLEEMTDGILKEGFLENNIKSILLLPIFLQNELYGYISFVDCHRRKLWAQEDLSFLQSLSKSLTNALEKRFAEARAKEKEEQLRKNEKKFKALVQEGSDLMIILDSEANLTFISTNVYNILGVKPEELIGKNIFQFIHQEEREKLMEQFEKLNQSKRMKIAPFRCSDSEGNWIWLEATAVNLLDDPAVQGFVINSHDISTILQQAREIEHVNERYRLAAMATQDIIYDWDLIEDRIIRFHNSPTKLFGYSQADVNSSKFWPIHIHPSDLERVSKHLQDAIAHPNESLVQNEYRFARSDGSYALVMDKGYILRDPDNRAIRIIGATSDISDIKEKEEALEIANERFKLAMDATNEMIYDWDVLSGVMKRSQAYEDLYGYSLSQNHPANSFWFSRTLEHDRKRVENSLNQALKNKEQFQWKEEYDVLRADDSVAHIIDRASLQRDKDGNVTRMVGAVLDISNTLELLKEVQKQNKVLREIAWEQSHVVRAPLARLKGLIQLLELQGFEKMEQKKIIEHINSSAEELDDIVKSIVARSEDLDQ